LKPRRFLSRLPELLSILEGGNKYHQRSTSKSFMTNILTGRAASLNAAVFLSTLFPVVGSDGGSFPKPVTTAGLMPRDSSWTMTLMKYQLVLQWPASSVKDYDHMIWLEEALTKGICHIALVDGHNAGSG